MRVIPRSEATRDLDPGETTPPRAQSLASLGDDSDAPTGTRVTGFIVRRGTSKPHGKRLRNDVKRRRSHQLTIRLPGQRRRRLDPDVPTLRVKHATDPCRKSSAQQAAT